MAFSRADAVYSIALLVFIFIAGFLSANAYGEPIEEKQDNVVRILKIKEACRVPTESLEEFINVPKSKFTITKRDLPDWGHEEDWALDDKDELARLGLRALLILIEQDMLQSIMFDPGLSLDVNLARVGLSKADVEISEYGKLIDVRTKDKQGFPILINHNGTLYQCFEHHPGH